MKRGKFTLVLGNMFSGKTAGLIKDLEIRKKYRKQHILVFKPKTDTRSGDGQIKSSTGDTHPAIDIPAETPSAAINEIKQVETESGIRIDFIVFDEVQFFDKTIFNVIDGLLDNGYEVMAMGLKLNFRGEAFEASTSLIALLEDASSLKIVHSFCTVCGKPAHYPQRIIDGKPADYDSPVVLVGGEESYSAKCKEHHCVPKKPRYY